MSLYETLKAAKIGAASDVFTTLRGRQAPFAKGGVTEKELTDTPPLSFTGNGEPLIDWIINGASGGVGDATANIIDYTQSETGGIDGSGNYAIALNLWRSTVYTAIDATLQYFVSWVKAFDSFIAVRINYYTEDKTHIIREQISKSGSALTIPENAAYFKWVIYTSTGTVIDLSYVQALRLMFNSGSAALPYEPYGYKIPVTCGGETNTIYLNAQLGASDSISMTDTSISIPTVDGSNTLSVGTTVQPSSVYIKYKE